MTTYHTGNAIGSADPRDLYDNAQVIDQFANSDELTAEDRLGTSRRTIAGLNAAADQAIANAGYVFIGDYAPGIEITARNQVIRADGELWRLSASVDLPYTTTGDWATDSGDFVAMGDAVLRQDLAAGTASVLSSLGAQTVAEALDARIAYAPSIAALSSLSSELLSPGQIFDIYGSRFRWDGDDFLPIDRVHLKAFGAEGDGSTDDSDAIYEAWQSGWPLRADARDRFLIASMPQVVDTSIDFDGNGCTFLIGGDTEIINAKAAFKSVTTISSITSSTADLSDSTTGPGEVTVLTVADASGYAHGDIVKVLSDDLILGETSNRRRAEYAQVFSVSGSEVTLFSRLLGTYSTNPRLAKLNSEPRFSFVNANVTPIEGADEAWSTPAVRVIGYASPRLGYLSFVDLLERATLLVSCYEPKSSFLKGESIRTNQAQDAFGYLIHEVACHAGYHHRPEGRNVRHVYTCSAFGTEAGSASIENYGGTRATTVDHGYGFNCTAAAFDTHADGEDITFSSCVAESPHKGHIGALMNFGLRGRNNRCVNCKSIGGTGYRAFSDYASPDNSRGHEFVNCAHKFNPNESEGRAAFDVFGMMDGFVTGVRVVNPKVDQRSGYAPSFYAERGDMTVVAPDVQARQSGSTQGIIFEAVVGGTIRSSGGQVDYTGATGAGLRTVRSPTDFSAVYVDGLRVVAASGWALIADLGDNDGTAIVTGLDATAAPGFNVQGIHGLGGAPLAYIDYTVNGGRDGALSNIPSVTRGAGGFTVNIERRGCPVVYYSIITTEPGCQVTGISPGHFVGQQLVIRNHPTSDSNYALTSGTNTAIGSDYNVSPGRAYRLRWDGFNWVSA